jgi:S-adenosylmethionine decarboxylase
MPDSTAVFHIGGALDTQSHGLHGRRGVPGADLVEAGTTPDVEIMTDRPTTGFEPASHGASDENLDHFIVRDGKAFAGTHLIIDVWDGERLDDLPHVEAALRRCVEEAGATLLHIHLHHFTPNGGISGVAVLAESHISIHSWPERSYAALDVFMCGESVPQKAVPVLQEAFATRNVEVREILRGEIALDAEGRETAARGEAA